MIDNESVQPRVCRLQFQPELFMQSFLQRRYLNIIRWNVLKLRSALPFRSEFNREIEPPAESRLLHRRAIQDSER